MVKDRQIDEDAAPLVAGANPTPPFLSIIVPAYNEALRIGRSLDRIRAYLNSKAFSGEVIVVGAGPAGSAPAIHIVTPAFRVTAVLLSPPFTP